MREGASAKGTQQRLILARDEAASAGLNLHPVQAKLAPMEHLPQPRLRLRLHFGDLLQLGPGKAELMEGIRATGSIAAAGRAMGMSYKRAWLLVEELNAAFTAPLITSARGGAGGGGAQLTQTGEAVLAQFRALEARIMREGAGEIAAISALLRHPAS